MLHGGNYTYGDHPFTHTTSQKDKAVGTKNLNSSDQWTDFHRSNVHVLGQETRESLFILLVAFSSGFFAAI
jgi:hypothetical protein